MLRSTHKASCTLNRKTPSPAMVCTKKDQKDIIVLGTCALGTKYIFTYEATAGMRKKGVFEQKKNLEGRATIPASKL